LPPTDVKRATRAAIAEIRRLKVRAVPTIRPIRRQLSAAMKSAPPSDVLAAADDMIRAGLAWIGFELIFAHPAALEALTIADVERLGAGMSSWGEVDAFGSYIAGPAWLSGQIPTRAVRRWTRSPSRWWRRAALVATTVLNTRSRGGRGDTERTLDIAARLVKDTDDMVVKALSWSLRSLISWDRRAVEEFLASHHVHLAARVKREVTTKLRTGLKSARRSKPV
jgi:hypothetical protein